MINFFWRSRVKVYATGCYYRHDSEDPKTIGETISLKSNIEPFEDKCWIGVLRNASIFYLLRIFLNEDMSLQFPKSLADVDESVKAAALEASSFKEAGFKAVKIKVDFVAWESW